MMLSGDFARGINDESGRIYYGGGRLALRFPALSVWVAGGTYDPRLEGEGWDLTVGGGAAINFLKTPSLPVSISLQLGGGAVGMTSENTTVNAIAGLAFTANIPSGSITVHPWIMPRGQGSWLTLGEVTVRQLGAGASGGLDIDLPIGLGIHSVVDVIKVWEGSPSIMTLQGGTVMTVGGGLHYAISIPNFGAL